MSTMLVKTNLQYCLDILTLLLAPRIGLDHQDVLTLDPRTAVFRASPTPPRDPCMPRPRPRGILPPLREFGSLLNSLFSNCQGPVQVQVESFFSASIFPEYLQGLHHCSSYLWSQMSSGRVCSGHTNKNEH